MQIKVFIFRVVIFCGFLMGLALSAFAGGLTINDDSTLTLGEGTFLTVDGDVTIDGTLNGGSGSISLTGNWVKAETGTFICETSTITFDGSSDQTITSGGAAFYNLIHSSSVNVLPGDDLAVNGDLTIHPDTGGTLDLTSHNLTMGGSISNGGVISAVASSLTSLSGAGKTFGGSGTAAFYNLLVSDNYSLDASSGTHTVWNDLTVDSGETLTLNSPLVVDDAGGITNNGLITENIPGGYIRKNATSVTLVDSGGSVVTTYNTGDNVYIKLIDEDENLNGAAPDTNVGNFQIVVTGTGDTENIDGTYITLRLTETGNATETFDNTGTDGLDLAVASASNNDGTLQCNATDTLTITYTDSEDSTDTKPNTASVELVTTPTVSTAAATNITVNSATGNGNITDTGNENCDQRGVEWGTTQGGPYPDSATDSGSFETGTFTKGMTGLIPGTTYYYRAKAHNSAGWGYGGEVSFITQEGTLVEYEIARDVSSFEITYYNSSMEELTTRPLSEADRENVKFITIEMEVEKNGMKVPLRSTVYPRNF